MYTKTKVEEKLIPAGTYEVTIEKMEFKETPTTHRKKISVAYRIRSDVEANGEAKNRVMFDDIWSDRDDDTKYDTDKINRLLSTQTNIPDGTDFKTINDIVATLLGACLRIKISIKYDDYQNKDVNKMFRDSYFPSNFAPKSLNEPIKGNTQGIEISDDELPF